MTNSPLNMGTSKSRSEFLKTHFLWHCFLRGFWYTRFFLPPSHPFNLTTLFLFLPCGFLWCWTINIMLLYSVHPWFLVFTGANFLLSVSFQFPVPTENAASVRGLRYWLVFSPSLVLWRYSETYTTSPISVLLCDNHSTTIPVEFATWNTFLTFSLWWDCLELSYDRY